MQKSITKARVLLEVWFAHMSAYRAEIVIWILTGSLPLIMLAVWIGKAATSGGSVQGFTAQGFAAYFLAAWLTQQWIVAWVSWEMDFLIRQGQLSPKLLRPIDPFWEQLATHVTERMVRAPFMLVVLAAGLLLVPGTRLTPDLWHALAYLLSIQMAFLIRFLIAYCIGIVAFWWEQAVALDELYFTVAAFLTGSFAPLDLYPQWARAIIDWLPFPYVIYYPVQVLNGTLSWEQTARVFAVQGLWLLAFVLLRGLLWQRGLARYGAAGA